jgi:Domain of unknown function (DUF5615)
VLAFAADENFNNDILRALLRRQSELDIVRIQDTGLTGADDRRVLEWAASEGRVLLTHDATTITRFAYERVEGGLPMPGVFELAQDLPIAIAVEEILLLAQCSLEGEWEGQVRYLPLR